MAVLFYALGYRDDEAQADGAIHVKQLIGSCIFVSCLQYFAHAAIRSMTSFMTSLAPSAIFASSALATGWGSSTRDTLGMKRDCATKSLLRLGSCEHRSFRPSPDRVRWAYRAFGQGSQHPHGPCGAHSLKRNEFVGQDTREAPPQIAQTSEPTFRTLTFGRFYNVTQM